VSTLAAHPARDPAGARALRLARVALRLVVRTAAGFALVISLAVAVPGVIWHSTMTVLSGSMTPTLRVGDVVVDQRIAPLDARVGDVITFRDPEDARKLYTHRVVGISVTGDTVSFVTKGDANTGVERWSIPESGSLGRVMLRVPKLGYVTDRAGSRVGKLLLIVAPAFLLGVFEIRRIWRKGP
jgi:signal peptidase I